MMRPFVLLALYLIVVCLPLGLSWALDLPPRSFRNELATGLGMLAFAMILTEFVLSGRFRAISGGIGMDVTMRFHQLMARTALVAALLHPFLYRWPPGPQRPWDPTRVLTLTIDIVPLASGIAAFVLLPTLVMWAIYRDDLEYRHETWRLFHGLGSLLIAGLLWHHTTTAGRHGIDPVMVWLWSAMTGIALLSLVFVYVLKPAYQVAHPWRVSRIGRLTPRQWQIRVAPDGHNGIDYKAGQFVWLNIGHSPASLNENPFSISSAPSQGPELEFVVKELGDFTSSLDSVTEDTRAYIDGPHGTLTVADRAEPGIGLIAGGVGIAPLLSILRECQATDDPREVTLIYANRTSAQIVFAEELERMADRPGARVIHTLTEPAKDWTGETGFVDRDLLTRAFEPQHFAAWVFVICGPPAMIMAVEAALGALGVPPDRILSERFQYD